MERVSRENRYTTWNRNLTLQQRENRLHFALNNIDRDWSKVIFSDEKSYTFPDLSRPYNLKTYWCVNENIQPRNERISGGLWGWMNRDGPGEISFTSGPLHSDEYCDMLEDVFISSVHIRYEDLRDLVFIQDASPIHKSSVTRGWFSGHPEITVLNLPSNSPDLNLFEDFLAEVTKDCYKVYPRNRAALHRSIVRKWKWWRGQKEYFSNLYDSMPNRLRDVIKNNGGPIIY